MKNDEFNPEAIKLPENLEGRQWLSVAEFCKIIGISRTTAWTWSKRGYLKIKKFTPRCCRIPVTEIDRLKNGELIDAC